MAAECARDALLKRVIDNKENAGILLLRCHSLFFCVIFFDDELEQCFPYSIVFLCQCREV